MARSQLQALFQESLESLQEVEVIELSNEEIIAFEEELKEIDELEEVMDDTEGDADDLNSIAEGLEGLIDTLEIAIEKFGGLDPVGAELLHHSMDGWTYPLGVNVEELLPSVEQFGGDSERIAATTIALEAGRETLQRVWAAIKNAIQNAIKAVEDFYKKIFDAVGTLERNAKAAESSLQSLIKDKKTAYTKSSTISFGGSEKLIMGDNSGYDMVLAGVKNLGAHFKYAEGIAKDSASIYSELSKNSIGLVKELPNITTTTERQMTPEEIKKVSPTYSRWLDGSVDGLKALIRGKFDDSRVISTVTKNTHSSGGYTFHLKTIDIGKFKMHSVSYKSANTKSKGGTFAAYSADQTMNLLKLVSGEIIPNIKSARNNINELAKNRKQVISELDKAVREASGVKDTAKAAAADAGMRVLMRIANYDFAKAYNQVVAHAFSVSRALLSMASAQISNYSAEKVSKEEAEDVDAEIDEAIKEETDKISSEESGDKGTKEKTKKEKAEDDGEPDVTDAGDDDDDGSDKGTKEKTDKEKAEDKGKLEDKVKKDKKAKEEKDED